MVFFFLDVVFFSLRGNMRDNQKRGEQKNIIPLAVKFDITPHAFSVYYVFSPRTNQAQFALLSLPHALQQTTNFESHRKGES